MYNILCTRRMPTSRVDRRVDRLTVDEDSSAFFLCTGVFLASGSCVPSSSLPSVTGSSSTVSSGVLPLLAGDFLLLVSAAFLLGVFFAGLPFGSSGSSDLACRAGERVDLAGDWRVDVPGTRAPCWTPAYGGPGCLSPVTGRTQLLIGQPWTPLGCPVAVSASLMRHCFRWPCVISPSYVTSDPLTVLWRPHCFH